MKNTKTIIIMLSACIILTTACGRTDTAETESETETISEKITDLIDSTDETMAESSTGTEPADIAYIYADNWGVVHNIWELSYDETQDPPYLYEYRRSDTPHTQVVETCPVSKEDGDRIFALFAEKDIINAPDSVDDSKHEQYGINPSGISFGYAGDDTVYHRYPPSEDFSAILDSLIALGENAETSTEDSK